MLRSAVNGGNDKAKRFLLVLYGHVLSSYTTAAQRFHLQRLDVLTLSTVQEVAVEL